METGGLEALKGILERAGSCFLVLCFNCMVLLKCVM